MDNNGIIAIYDLEGGDTSVERDVRNYLSEIEHFNNNMGKEILEKLRKERPKVYKEYSESQQRSYRNWQNGKNIPERNALIKLCFDYNICYLDEINSLLYAFNYEALHLRNVEDLCYYFALKKSISYNDAKEKVSEQKEIFEKEFGKESGESKRTSTGLYTRMVLEDINSANTWQDLYDYIEENKSKLGRIKVTAYKKLKRFINEFDDYDKEGAFYETDEVLPNQKIIEAVRKSMGLPEANIKIPFSSVMKRTTSVSRGVFILYCLKIIFNPISHKTSEQFKLDINNELDKCSFAPLNPQRCLWDKIVTDCIEASLADGLYFDDENAAPYDLAITFLGYIQDSEK